MVVVGLCSLFSRRKPHDDISLSEDVATLFQMDDSVMKMFMYFRQAMERNVREQVVLCVIAHLPAENT